MDATLSEDEALAAVERGEMSVNEFRVKYLGLGAIEEEPPRVSELPSGVKWETECTEYQDSPRYAVRSGVNCAVKTIYGREWEPYTTKKLIAFERYDHIDRRARLMVFRHEKWLLGVPFSRVMCPRKAGIKIDGASYLS